MTLQKFLFLLALCLLLLSCNRDEVKDVNCDSIESVVYDGEIEAIINASCAFAVGCHDSGSGKRDYTSYEEIIGSNLEFFVFSITTKSGDIMPPLFASGLGTVIPPLTELEIITLQCWAQNGYLEN